MFECATIAGRVVICQFEDADLPSCELLPAWSVQCRVQRDRPLHVEPTRAVDPSQIRAGKSGLSKKQLRHRFCDMGWRFAHNGVALTGASGVSVVCYRYRGHTIATP